MIGVGAIGFGKFLLTSRKESDYYIDIKKVSTKPRILREYNYLSLRKPELKFESYDRIGSVPIGGTPLATALSLETDIEQLLVRKEQREHGTRRQIEGDYEPKMEVLIVEDVATVGGSISFAAKVCRDEGLVVKDAYVLVDREEGATDALRKEGINLISLIKRREIMERRNTTSESGKIVLQC
ncbi:MAG: orotate phosphoribosyltransferase [Candidatus Aenigmatarchaeota archaeon]